MENFPVFLITGQSNADGFAPADELPADLNVPAPFGDDVLVYVHNAGNPFFAPLSAVPIDTPGGTITTNETGPAILGVAGPRFGPEMTFARAIRAAYPGRRFGIVKYAIDASALFPVLNTNFGLTNNWASSGGVHRTNWTIRMGLAALALNGLGLRMNVRGQIHHQGESDSMFGELPANFDGAINSYGGSHRSLINFFRSSCMAGGLTSHPSVIPFAQALISDDWYAEVPDPWMLGVGYSALLQGVSLTRLQGIQGVLAAQLSTAILLPEVYSTPTDGLGNNGPGDMIHLNGAGQIAHGENYAALLEPFFDDPTPTFLVSELSVRVPLIVRGRNVTHVGKRCDRLVNVTDVPRTILAQESLAPASAMDGVSIVPFFADVKAAQVHVESYAEVFTTTTGFNPAGGVADIETGETNDPENPQLVTWDRSVRLQGYTLIQRNEYDGGVRAITYELYNHQGGDTLNEEQILLDQDLDFDSVRRDTSHWRGLRDTLAALAGLEP